MKLILCENCWDVFKLQKGMRQCSCGEVFGRYIDNVNAEVSGNAVSIGLGNGALEKAIIEMREHRRRTNDTATREEYFEIGKGLIIPAWVRPNDGPGNPHCKTISP